MLGWLLLKFRNRHDPALTIQTLKRSADVYSFDKAIAGKRRGEAREAKRLHLGEAKAALKQADKQQLRRIVRGAFTKEQAR